LAKKKEEEREHGIFYDDDYDYLQHLKNRSDPVSETCPSLHCSKFVAT
jgi:hypothetical protein